MARNNGKKARNNVTMLQIFEQKDGDYQDENYRKTQETRERFLEMYEISCGNISVSCIYADISRQTYYRWMASAEPDCLSFQENVRNLKPAEKLFDIAEAVVLGHLQSGSLRAAELVLLKNKKAHERGYTEPPLEKADENKELAELKRQIEAVANKYNSDYQTELKFFLETYSAKLKPEVKEKLASELIN